MLNNNQFFNNKKIKKILNNNFNSFDKLMNIYFDFDSNILLIFLWI